MKPKQKTNNKFAKQNKTQEIVIKLGMKSENIASRNNNKASNIK